MNKTKILISPGFGAGWSTWCGLDDEPEKLRKVLTWAPLIEALERGEDRKSAVDSLVAEVGDFYLGGLCNLKVVEVSGPFRVEEYDGFESVIEQNADEGWISL